MRRLEDSPVFGEEEIATSFMNKTSHDLVEAVSVRIARKMVNELMKQVGDDMFSAKIVIHVSLKTDESCGLETLDALASGRVMEACVLD